MQPLYLVIIASSFATQDPWTGPTLVPIVAERSGPLEPSHLELLAPAPRNLVEPSGLDTVLRESRRERAVPIRYSKREGVHPGFVANDDRFPDEVAYELRTAYGMAFVLRDGAIVHAIDGGTRSLALRERLVGATRVAMETSQPAATRVNYFLGNDSRGWRTDVPTYATIDVRIENLKIACRLQAAGGNLEKIFEVAAGADPERIAIEIVGQSTLMIDSDSGELVARNGDAYVTFSAPVAYQVARSGSWPVEVRYRLLDGTTYGFEVGAYDRSAPLYIDPVIAGSLLGGASSDAAWDLALDASGNAYVTGETLSSGFPTTPGAYDGTKSGAQDCFVAKFDPTLTQLLSSTYVGGTGAELPFSIDVAANGDVTIAGGTQSTDFPVTSGAFQTSAGGGVRDGFVTRLGNGLNVLKGSSYFGGGGEDYFVGLKGDYLGGHVVVTGPKHRAMIGVTNSNLSTFSWVSFDDPSGATNDSVNAIETHGSSVYGAGLFALSPLIMRLTNGLSVQTAYTLSLPPTNMLDEFSGLERNPVNGRIYAVGSVNAESDALLASFDTTLSSFTAAFVGGSGSELGRDMDIDETGNLVVTGETYSTDFPVSTNAFDASLSASGDCYLAKVDPNLTSVLAGTYLGGSQSDHPFACVVSPMSGDVLICGQTASSQFPTTAGAFDTTPNGSFDAFVLRISSNFTSASLIAIGGTSTVSASQGGTQSLLLDAGSHYSGSTYLLVGSASGTVPGFSYGGKSIPLNFDSYLVFTATTPNSLFLQTSFGTLDSLGRGISTLSVPAGTTPAAAGLSLNHAFVTLDPLGNVTFVSNPLAVNLTP